MLADRRVVQQRDPVVAAGDRREPVGERVHLGGRLGVDLAQQRLAEVGQRRVGEAADEALRADDRRAARRRAPGSRGRGRACARPRPRAARRQLGRLVAVPVVVAEHGVDRRLERRAELGEQLGLLELAVGRQVAGEQDASTSPVDAGEGALRSRRGWPRRRARRPPRRRESAWACGRIQPIGVAACRVRLHHGRHGDRVRAAARHAEAGRRRPARRGDPVRAGRRRRRLGATAARRPSTTSTSSSSPRTPSARSQALAESGFRPEKPPESWLYKAWDGDVLVDLIFEPTGMTVDDALFERTSRARGERGPDARRPAEGRARLQAAGHERARARLRAGCSRSPAPCASRSTGTRSGGGLADSPFAKAFFTLVDELGITA